MNSLKELLKKYELKPNCYRKNGKVTIVDSKSGKYVIKELRNDINKNIYKYLESRNFNYYPSIINADEEDNYQISEYVEEIEMPEEQKMLDLIELVSLLHYKTTHYKEVDEDDYKKIYEDILNNINYLYSYYIDVISIIETKVYMSPSEYLLARNISKIFSSIEFCRNELDKWYDIVKEKRKQRLVVLHNNLELNHFIKNNNSYLISWDKSKIDIPIFDLYKLYKKHALEFDFEMIFRAYERNYQLLEEERKLLFILITLPDKIEFNLSEYEMCKKISRLIDIIYKTEVLLSPYYSEKKEYNSNNKETK